MVNQRSLDWDLDVGTPETMINKTRIKAENKFDNAFAKGKKKIDTANAEKSAYENTAGEETVTKTVSSMRDFMEGFKEHEQAKTQQQSKESEAAREAAREQSGRTQIEKDLQDAGYSKRDSKKIAGNADKTQTTTAANNATNKKRNKETRHQELGKNKDVQKIAKRKVKRVVKVRYTSKDGKTTEKILSEKEIKNFERIGLLKPKQKPAKKTANTKQDQKTKVATKGKTKDRLTSAQKKPLSREEFWRRAKEQKQR